MFDRTAILFFERASNYTNILFFENSPSISAHRNSEVVQIVLNFFQILIGVHRVHDCEKNTDCLSLLGLLPPGVNPPVPDVVDVLGEVVREQYIVLQCKINESTS